MITITTIVAVMVIIIPVIMHALITNELLDIFKQFLIQNSCQKQSHIHNQRQRHLVLR